MKLSDLSIQESISGSPHFLGKELRLDGISHFLEILCDAYGNLCAQTKITLSMGELRINEEFYRHLLMVWIEKGPKTITPIHEKPHGKRTKGRGKTPTIDICFRDWDPDIYFGVECKILENKKSRYDYYVDDGVCRYIRGDYSKKFPVGAMIGYIINDDSSKIINEVKLFVDKVQHTSNMKISNHINGFKKHYKSTQKRKIGSSPFEIHHLFFKFN